MHTVYRILYILIYYILTFACFMTPARRTLRDPGDTDSACDAEVRLLRVSISAGKQLGRLMVIVVISSYVIIISSVFNHCNI